MAQRHSTDATVSEITSYVVQRGAREWSCTVFGADNRKLGWTAGPGPVKALEAAITALRGRRGTSLRPLPEITGNAGSDAWFPPYRVELRSGGEIEPIMGVATATLRAMDLTAIVPEMIRRGVVGELVLVDQATNAIIERHQVGQ